MITWGSIALYMMDMSMSPTVTMALQCRRHRLRVEHSKTLHAVVPELVFQACQTTATVPQSRMLNGQRQSWAAALCMSQTRAVVVHSKVCLRHAHPHRMKVARSTQSHPCLRNVKPSTCSITESIDWGVSHILRPTSCLSGFHATSMAAKAQDVTLAWLIKFLDMKCCM